ncbi:unnamed protein product, partial [Sphacelaria rigidula]
EATGEAVTVEGDILFFRTKAPIMAHVDFVSTSCSESGEVCRVGEIDVCNDRSAHSRAENDSASDGSVYVLEGSECDDSAAMSQVEDEEEGRIVAISTTRTMTTTSEGIAEKAGHDNSYCNRKVQ